MVTIHDVLRQKAEAIGAVDWLRTLDDTVHQLAERWGLQLGRVHDTGTESWVAEVTMAGTGAPPRTGPAVLKILLPGEDGAGARSVPEAAVLQLAGGVGCAELFAHDPDHGALLLERLGPSLADTDAAAVDRQRLLCEAAASMWQPASSINDVTPFRTGAEKARWLQTFVEEQWRDLDEPCSRRTIDHALEAARKREAAHRRGRCVLVHGDVHQWNLLQCNEGWKLVDPDGQITEPEYDLGIIMREDPDELLLGDTVVLAAERAERLAGLTGLDPAATAEWGVIERVSTGLVCMRVGLESVGTEMLQVAERLAE